MDRFEYVEISVVDNGWLVTACTEDDDRRFVFEKMVNLRYWLRDHLVNNEDE
jgi:hypothetical protein